MKHGQALQLLRADYARFLAEYRLQEADVQRMVQGTADQVPLPAGFEHLRRGPSAIHGEGMFSANAIAAGQVIGPARLGGKRTPLGRYVNHSPQPNIRFAVAAAGGLDAVALRSIAACEELTLDYRQAGQVNGVGLTPDAQEALITTQLRRNGGAHITTKGEPS
jgi:hypothetical protein